MATLGKVIEELQVSFQEVDELRTPTMGSKASRSNFDLAHHAFTEMEDELAAAHNNGDDQSIDALLQDMQVAFNVASATEPLQTTTFDTLSAVLDDKITRLKRALPRVQRQPRQQWDEEQASFELPVPRGHALRTPATASSEPDRSGHRFTRNETDDTARMAMGNIYKPGADVFPQVSNHTYDGNKAKGNSRVINGDCFDSSFMSDFMK